MYHGAYWCHQPANIGKVTVRADLVITDIRGSITLGFVAETNHLIRVRVEFWVRGEGDTRKLTFKIIETLSLESVGIYGVRRGVLLKGEQLAIKENHVSISGASYLETDRISEFIAIFSCNYMLAT